VHEYRRGKVFQILRGESIGRLIIEHAENTVLVDWAQAYSPNVLVSTHEKVHLPA
jgi:hypothetical protein